MRQSVRNSFLGFDPFLSALEAASGSNQHPNYPPHCVYKTADGGYIIKVAVAGYSREDLTATLEDGILSIKADKSADLQVPDDAEIVYAGLSQRAWEMRFRLHDTLYLDGTRLHNGILTFTIKAKVKVPTRLAITID
jgi:molecular chaperone IbpA